MPTNGRKFVRVVKFLLAGVTIFCLSWIASVSEWNATVRWTSRPNNVDINMSTMRTIVAYSEKKQAEMNRPMPVTCDRLPVFPKLRLFNHKWTRDSLPREWQRVEGTDVKLFAAYYDRRTEQHYIRILATFQGRSFSSEVTLYCQTRSINPYEESVEVVAAKPLEIWWHKWDTTHLEVETPLLLTCPLTGPLYGPSIVSIVTQPCHNPTNAFKLKPANELKKKKRVFTICVKDMKFYQDISQNLIEWIETNIMLGVDMIDIYVDKVTRHTEDVLLHYQNKGFVRLFHVPIKHKVYRSLWQRRRDHIVTYNDCLYRNLEESEFIVPLDVDEVIMPKIANTWPELLARFRRLGWDSSEQTSIVMQNVFFFDFMQGLDKYERINLTDKIYVKRDDVRIKELENLGIKEVELIDDFNYLNRSNLHYNAIDEEDKVLYEMYKSRCWRDLPKPKLATHIVRSAVISPMGYYSKSWMLTKKVLMAFNHYPLDNLGTSGFVGWPPPFKEVQLNHYKESCNNVVMGECARYGRRARIDTAALRLRHTLTRALSRAICKPLNII
ncbi:uncharacterized protein LOC142977975 [Anticarsia gemmatalis]|uniref:uncharacterized protein LOC142977975 n=1 Tax=Anticarsia gemmatalis TaxID=129554 RepID=UPI003F765DB5